MPDAPPGRIFVRFLRFGFLAWGGPVAQIAMLRRDLVDEEHWVTSERFNRLLAVYQALPGPEAHELAVHLGTVRGGRVGGLAAGLGFMLPGFFLVLLLSALYVQIDLAQPWILAAVLGIQVAVVALVTRAVQRIGRHILVDRWLWAIGLLAAAATVAGITFWAVLPLGGAAYVLAGRVGGRDRIATAATAALLALGAVVVVVTLALLANGLARGLLGPGAPLPGTTLPGVPVEPTLAAIFLSGLKAGLLTFGGAYTAIPFVRGDAVGSGWLTDGQFLDGLALSGIVPAPLIIFATFVGYLAGGLVGAILMTAGVFVPAFAFSIVFGDRLEAIVDRPGFRRALEGVAAAVVGLIAVTALDLAVALAGRVPSLPGAAVILLASLVVLARWPSKVAVPAVIAAGAVAGWLVFATG